MFSDYSRDLLRTGIIEFKAGNRESARRYLDRCVYMSSDHDVMAEAWYWLSQATDDVSEKRQSLENALANDIHHARARRLLAVLDGKLKSEEIIDPNAAVTPAGTHVSQAQRFTCARCGGRMAFTPDGRSLICEYCRRREHVSPDTSSINQNDFVLAMATRRGHSQPLREQVRRCQGCGAEFIHLAAELSFSCPYCASAHVIVVDPSSNLIAPDGILPHAFDARRAQDLLTAWLRAEHISTDLDALTPRGLYLPIWTFTFGGGIDYTGEASTDPNDALRGRPARAVQVHDRYPVMLTLSVAASRRPSAPFVRLIPGFDLGRVKTYDARYLAAWPAELYDVSMADASLEARSRAYNDLQCELPGRLAPLQVTSTSSASLMIESFRLDLLPVWICESRRDGHGGLLLINGQTGVVAGDGLRPGTTRKGGLIEWLGDLLTE